MKQRFSTALRQPLIALPTSDGVFLMIVGAFAAIVCNEIHGALRAVIKAVARIAGSQRTITCSGKFQ